MDVVETTIGNPMGVQQAPLTIVHEVPLQPGPIPEAAALGPAVVKQETIVHEVPLQLGPIPEAAAVVKRETVEKQEEIPRGPGWPPRDKIKTEAEKVKSNLKRRLSEVVGTWTGISMKSDRNMRPRTKRWSLQQIPQKLLSGGIGLPVK